MDNHQIQNLNSSFIPEIHQEVYFYNTKTYDVSEIFKINGRIVENQIGYLNEANNLVWKENLDKRYEDNQQSFLINPKVLFINSFQLCEKKV